MVAQYQAQKPYKVEDDCMMMYEHKRMQKKKVQFMKLCRKSNG